MEIAMKRRFALALLALFALATSLHAADEAASPAAPTEDHAAQIDAARTALDAWLKLADAGDYAGTWNTGAAGFKAQVTEAMWTQMATSVRTPLGAVQTRTESTANYSNALPGAPAGEYVVIQFKTSFANAAQAMETVIATLDADGTWRATAYLIQ
jgi:hypothetical protein